MLAARGTYRFLCDADLSMPIEQIERFLPPVLDGCDVAIGSREAHGARRYDEPGYRHLMGRVFNSIVKLLAVPGLEDTQCGFKGFKGSAATSIFSRQTMDGFGFDVEALFIARKLGCRIIEVGIDWYFAANSRVQPIHDTIQMVEDVLKVRWNDLRGVYDG
jgi:dolichyl-phosphate beta-glucosyltransferase